MADDEERRHVIDAAKVPYGFIRLGGKIILPIVSYLIRGGRLMVNAEGATGPGLPLGEYLVEVFGSDGIMWAESKETLMLPAGKFAAFTQPFKRLPLTSGSGFGS